MLDIWGRFLPLDKIGIDAVIETFVLYDYMRQKKKKVVLYDLILMISDITQSLLNRSDTTYLLHYLDEFFDYINFNKIMKKRLYYHSKFKQRLDYNSAYYDNNFCEVNNY
jgi:hypothetical protein